MSVSADRSPPESAVTHVLEWLEENTESVPDEEHRHALSNVWAGGNQLTAQARKDRIPFDVDELEDALDELTETGAIITWHGLVAPATDEHLQAIIETEKRGEFTRRILVAKANRLRATGEVP